MREAAEQRSWSYVCSAPVFFAALQTKDEVWGRLPSSAAGVLDVTCHLPLCWP